MCPGKALKPYPDRVFDKGPYGPALTLRSLTLKAFHQKRYYASFLEGEGDPAFFPLPKKGVSPLSRFSVNTG